MKHVDETISVTATIGSVVSTVLPQYVSVDADWWPANTSSSGGDWGNAGMLSLNLDHPTLQAVAKALSPGFFRIGGSLDDIVKYQMGGMSVEECTTPVIFRKKPWVLCLNTSRWDKINNFVKNAGLDLVFGLSYHKTNDGYWNASNPEALLKYSRDKGYSFYGVELGEEMAPSPDSSSFDNLVSSYGKLQGILKSLWPNNVDRPIVLGPCVGMTDETPGKHFKFMQHFLNETLSTDVLNAVCMHSYNNDGGHNWKHPGFLKQTLTQAHTMLDETRKYSLTTPIWCGECGPHNGGGIKNVTDRVISSFWYMDALGGLARTGFQQFGRQALIGSHYGLLSNDGNFQPNPDLYTALAWKKLMGTRVLKITLTPTEKNYLNTEKIKANDKQDNVYDRQVNTSNLPSSINLNDVIADNFHIYAHCSRASVSSGSVTIAFINISPNITFNIHLPHPQTKHFDYVFSPPSDASALLSKEVLLNGLALHMQGSKLPDINPSSLHISDMLQVLPLTYGFSVLPELQLKECM